MRPRRVPQPWRRLTFNPRITNVDDHMQNHGFLHVDHGQWRLAPAFDINSLPDKDRESKTWLSKQDGPITDVRMLLARSSYFALSEDQALSALGDVHTAVSNWRRIALVSEVGLRVAELDDFAPAFEHEQMDAVAVARLVDAGEEISWGVFTSTRVATSAPPPSGRGACPAVHAPAAAAPAPG
jgi:serine/threonine-protein kinase HipA